MTYIIKAPTTAYNRKLYGVQFENGVGRTENSQAASWYSGRSGFTVEVEKPVETKTTIDTMTVAELKTYAGEKGIDLTGAEKKAEILVKIKEVEGGE